MNTYHANICFKMPDGSTLNVPVQFDAMEHPAAVQFVSWVLMKSGQTPQQWTPPIGQAPVTGSLTAQLVRCPDCAREQSFNEVTTLVDGKDALDKITMPVCHCKVRVDAVRSKLKQAA